MEYKNMQWFGESGMAVVAWGLAIKHPKSILPDGRRWGLTAHGPFRSKAAAKQYAKERFPKSSVVFRPVKVFVQMTCGEQNKPRS